MSKKPVSKDKPASSPKRDDIGGLIEQIRHLVQSARRSAATAVNTLQVLTYYEIGRLIVEHDQQGHHRAAYGKETLKLLSNRLSSEFGRGFSERNLENMRKVFLTWRDRRPQISQKPSAKLSLPETADAVSTTSPANAIQFTLSWSHYIFLCQIADEGERRFYEIEAAAGAWSLPELRRQFDSGLYERLALSRNKKGVRELAAKGQLVQKPQDILKSPYVLEFLGLDERADYSESELETAIIDKLEHFLLELGKGFLFEARQKRFTFDEEHFFVDLVFYNRLLRCYVLIDLKIGKLTHQDLGQMQMYVNYFDRHVKLPDEQPSVGIILCKKKGDALVKITLPQGANIHAREYQLYLPSKEELRQRLMEWAGEKK